MRLISPLSIILERCNKYSTKKEKNLLEKGGKDIDNFKATIENNNSKINTSPTYNFNVNKLNSQYLVEIPRILCTFFICNECEFRYIKYDSTVLS